MIFFRFRYRYRYWNFSVIVIVTANGFISFSLLTYFISVIVVKNETLSVVDVLVNYEEYGKKITEIMGLTAVLPHTVEFRRPTLAMLLSMRNTVHILCRKIISSSWSWSWSSSTFNVCSLQSGMSMQAQVRQLHQSAHLPEGRMLLLWAVEQIFTAGCHP